MKFEKPIMNISMFEMENVVTEASGGINPPPAGETNIGNAIADATKNAETGNAVAVTVTF